MDGGGCQSPSGMGEGWGGFRTRTRGFASNKDKLRRTQDRRATVRGKKKGVILSSGLVLALIAKRLPRWGQDARDKKKDTLEKLLRVWGTGLFGESACSRPPR